MKILHVLSDLDGGGAEKIVFDYMSYFPSNVDVEYAVTSSQVGIIEKKLKDQGVKIYHIPKLREGIGNFCKSVNKILDNNKYNIVHSHLGYKSFLVVMCAKKKHVKVRIAHAHIAYENENIIKKIIRKIITHVTIRNSTNLFACGSDAAKWMWGRKFLKQVRIVDNAIDCKRFVYSNEARNKVRNELQISDDAFVIGNVARFSIQKNHEFLLDVFFEIFKLCPNSYLVLVGQGELYDTIISRIRKLNLKQHVILLGIRDDVSELLSSFDVFALPSKFEGLPVTLVEAQANGLPIFTSTNVTQEIKINDNLFFISLEKSAKHWAQEIINKNGVRVTNGLTNTKYDIHYSSLSLYEYYCNLLDR